MLDCIFTLSTSSNFSPMHFFCFSSYFLNLIVIFLPSIFIIFHQPSNSLCVIYCPLFILSFLLLLISITFKHPKSLLASVQKILSHRFPKEHKSILTNTLSEQILSRTQSIQDSIFFNLLVFGTSCTHHIQNNLVSESP